MEHTAKLTFQSISDTCRYPNKKFDNNKGEYYVYIKLDSNIDAFPWMNDYNELIIRGLNNINSLTIEYEINATVNYSFSVNNVPIIWNVTSTDTKQFIGEARDFRIIGSIKNNLSLNQPSTELIELAGKENNEYNELPEEIIVQLTAYIADGIKRAFQSK